MPRREGKNKVKKWKKRDQGTESKTTHPNPGNWCAHRRGRTDGKKEERTKKETWNGSPTQLPWTLQSPPTLIFYLHECIWNSTASFLPFQPLTIPTPSVILRIGWSIPLVPPWVIVFHFLVGKTYHFLFIPTFPCFLVLPLLTPQRYSTFECCLLGLRIYIVPSTRQFQQL